jgi:hypothetical protein
LSLTVVPGAAAPVDPALKRRTRQALAVAVYELHTYLLGVLSTVGEHKIDATCDLVLARHETSLSKRFKIMSVICAVVVRGATWEQIAAALSLDVDTARRLYGQAVERWCAGDPAPWNPLIPGPAAVAPPIPVDRLETLMRDLDDYFLAFAPSDPHALILGDPYPVSGGLPATDSSEGLPDPSLRREDPRAC